MGNFKYDVGVIGLGYVGLPLAIQATDSNLNVYGYVKLKIQRISQKAFSRGLH